MFLKNKKKRHLVNHFRLSDVTFEPYIAGCLPSVR